MSPKPLRRLYPLAAAFLFLTFSLLPAPAGAQQKEPAAPPAAADADAGADMPEAEQADVSQIEFEAIIRVEVDTKQPNFRVPWNIGGMGNGVGTGFLVGKNQFLTNAHVVSNNRLIYIKKVNDPKPYKARVLHVAHDCDLALLEVESTDEFESGFGKVKPLPIGGIPKLNTTVTAIGYPIGGERISVTRGVVSRVDFRPYSHSGVDFHLTIQVDAAINPGNSGGPVLQNNQVVGVAFQGYSGAVAQNTGYMIPVPVVSRFLKDVKDGRYDYYVDLATQTLNVLNPAQRIALGLPNDDIGVMVCEADPAGSAGGVLKTEDVLLSIDGHEIASDGFIEIEGERVNLNEIIERKYAGDTVKLEIWRNRKQETVEVKLDRFIPYLIQANTYDKQPEFVLFAGMQFQPLDRNLMAAHNISDLQVRYFFSYFASEALYKERPQVIVLTAVLPDSANTYLEPYVHKVIDTINGRKIRTLQDVYDALHGDAAEEGHGDFHVIRCLGEGRPLVMERATAKEAHQRIMAKYNVNFDNHIERPEILDVKGLFDEAEPEKGGKKDQDTPKAAPAKDAPKPTAQAGN
ncbi:MAG: trypsin-like peptidase domain-containing protein [Verrucomicrobiales bacterium]|nr:trypsin-like peptidase domain-containing protein [Verrucomicrobiales bacterium]